MPGSGLAVSPLVTLGQAGAPPGSSCRYNGPDLSQQERSSGSAEASSDGMKAKPRRDHRFAMAGWPGKDQISSVVEPGQLLQLIDLSLRDT